MFGRVGKAIRQLVFEEAARENVDLIFTYVYAYPQDNPEVQWMLEAVEKHGAKTLLVQLTCDRKKLNERVGADSRRTKGTIVDTELLNELAYDLRPLYALSGRAELAARHDRHAAP